jgi:ribonucleoside-triphosphate reductase (thioredoxin)
MIFKNTAAEFIYVRTYARWIDELGRRETWEETVDRYVTFLQEERGDKIPPKVLKKIREKILSFEVMPSMRALWAAGTAARQDNLTIYNCSALEVNSIDSFAEALYILMCGTGEGYSVRQSSVDQLSEVPSFQQNTPPTRHIVEDSRKGWAESVRLLLTALYTGTDIDFDYSLLRPKGAKLVVMGGRSSGPAPLITLHAFIRETLHKASGRKLSTLECSDIMNQIAESVVVGGVRRSSQISLSDLHDEAMRHAKDWPFPPRRYMSNNSAIYEVKPSAIDFLKEWSALASSGTGERGIFNLESLRKNAPTRRDKSLILLTNPCGEIALRNQGLCNLSEVVVRAEDDLDSLLDKVETATWLGSIQSTFTDFSYVNSQWKTNADEERLLGVSLTGQMDNPEMMRPEYLKALKAKAVKVARHASIKLGINMPAAITCVKPSGTVSQLVDSASGIHARFSPYYIRRYRVSSTDPLCHLLRDQGVKLSPENGQENLPLEEVTTFVVSFPSKSPEGAVTKDKLSALEQLEIYKKTQTNWCEHNVSMTVYVKDHEWFDVGNWVYNNWDHITGLSFLPFDGGKYKQAPYEEITKEQYEKMLAKFPHIDYSQLSRYETSDRTEGAKSYSCVGDKCELV